MGKFTCRRIARDGLQPVTNQSGGGEELVNAQLLFKVQKLGYCATCPYAGMDSVQADEYDARANYAEAERLESEAHLLLAKDELNKALTAQGLPTFELPTPPHA